MASDSGAAAGDRLSALGDAVLGHVLSFLPADEAARAAALSRRWRHVFAHVHTVALDEPEPPVPDYDGDWSPGWSPVDRNAAAPAAPFVNVVSSALLARLRRGGAAGVLRALRAGFHAFRGTDAGLVDMWLWYAMRQAGDELHVDLRLCLAADVCDRSYSLRRAAVAADEEGGDGHESWGYDLHYGRYEEPGGDDADSQDEDPASPKSESPAAGDDDDVDDEPPPPHQNEYVVPRSLFSCAALRTLRIGPCRLDLPPAAISLPTLDTLHLFKVTGRESSVQRLVSACPRLADLTLESCKGLTELDVLDKRLRRLALRCCHDLTAVAADSSELRAFEYRGAVPAPPFLTIRGGARGISSCDLDFCGEEVTDPQELDTLGYFLQLFAGVERLRLTSARLGCAPALVFPELPALRRLELTGMLPEDDAAAAVATVAGILERTPSLEALTLFFLPEPEDMDEIEYGLVDDEELLDGHKLKHDRHAALAVPDAEIHCLRERTKEISFVHYDGGLAQRTLAKFLLRNAPVVDEVCGEFAQGPLWIQTSLMEEIKGWVMNKSANMMFF